MRSFPGKRLAKEPPAWTKKQYKLKRGVWDSQLSRVGKQAEKLCLLQVWATSRKGKMAQRV